MSIMSYEAPAETKRVVASGGLGGKTVPLYIVCSPTRGVGKTLVSRLLTELHVIDGRPVSAFDLADEGPQLADFLPGCSSIADIGDVAGQMEFFDRLLADNETGKVIDLSHRVFRNFFLVVHKIGFFEEARRRSIEPIVLFLIDHDPKTAKAYAILRRWFLDAALVPVRNQFVANGQRYFDKFPVSGSVPLSVEIPVLAPALKALVDQHSFSFARFWGKTIERFPERLDDELRPWMKRAVLQFRQLELCVLCDGMLSSLVPKLLAQADAGPIAQR